MSDQQLPGFYAVGDEDTFLVSTDGQVFEVVRGGMAGPILTRVDALPPSEPHELMDGQLILPSVLLQAARVLDAPSPLRDLADVDVAHVDGLRREGLLVIEEDRAVLSPRCQRLLGELCTTICGRPFAASAGDGVAA